VKADPVRQTYHHGDARNALLQAASGLLEQTGAAGLSLRQVAEQAGLSRQAPYNHFADKESLLAELARDGFERLGRSTAAVNRADLDPTERLARASAGYIGFAQTAPALFRLMFSKELVDLSRHPATDAASAASKQHFIAIMAAIAPPERLDALGLAAWSMVHGYATLCIESGLEGAEQRQARARLFAEIIAAFAAS
jgi:AcrR family transcriptional regulator